MEFPRGIEEGACANSRDQLEKKWNLRRSRKDHVEFPWVLVFHLGISKWCHTILPNFQGNKLVFSGIFKDK